MGLPTFQIWMRGTKTYLNKGGCQGALVGKHLPTGRVQHISQLFISIPDILVVCGASHVRLEIVEYSQCKSQIIL